ncbi:YdcF family protein [Bacillus sp. ISL-18]|uniref:YdcF family protein n=1 Tax=Bacillus sp. ISL-18 TaxID=2819118 RepID=UPI001BE7BFB6|nr:YdcF family protein [Bacillus sp. ISL-18]MBT2658258.1 YdcF family protein [Bacillus sp. ISL-18]
MRKNKRMLSLIGFLVVVGLVYIGILQVKIIQYSHIKAPKNADYLIVLGARVKGKEPSKVLASRIDAAAKYLKENTDTLVIASGGKGPGEDITEAEAIKRELVSQGINKSRILLEEHSTDTYENIEFSKKFIPPNAELGLVVTNTFHIYRALSIANYQGLRVKGLSAETPWSAVIKSYSREYLAITKFYLERYIIGFK